MIVVNQSVVKVLSRMHSVCRGSGHFEGGEPGHSLGEFLRHRGTLRERKIHPAAPAHAHV